MIGAVACITCEEASEGEVTVFVTDECGCVDSDTARFRCVACEDPDPRTQGFWRRVCKKNHPDQPDRSILTVELCNDLNPDPSSDPCERARSQFAALLLNIASDRLQEGCIGTATGESVGDLVARIEALIAEGTAASCKEASDLAAALNEGGVSVPNLILNLLAAPEISYRRGDVNADASVNIVDPIRLFDYLFAGASAPPCLKAGDADGSGRLTINDPVLVLSHLFSGASIPEPFASCGVDSIPSDLTCESFLPCES